MPRVVKEKEELNKKKAKVVEKKGKAINKKEDKKTTSKEISKKTKASKSKATKKSETKKKEVKIVKKIETQKKEIKPAKKAGIKKKEVKTTKKIETKKKETKPAKKTETKKKEAKPAKKVEPKKREKKPEFIQEYYDLPYRYNETIVTILAQTPKKLFVYWDVSDKDRQAYIKAFGDDFFEKTYPVLLVHNEEMDYTFEVPINDFANSWYVDINDPKNNYVVQLGRKFKNTSESGYYNYDVVRDEHINLQNDFIYITDSNKLEIPNDHILFEKFFDHVRYRNMKNGNEYDTDVRRLLKDFEKTYSTDSVKELYKVLYSSELEQENIGANNPSSGSLSSPSGFMSASGFIK